MIWMLAALLLPLVLCEDLAELSPLAQGLNGLSFGERTERDISGRIPLSLENRWGVSLTPVVFSHMGYSDSALDKVLDILLGGVQTFMMDLYWNEFSNKWQLCPAPFGLNNSDGSSLVWEGKSYNCSMDVTVFSLINRFSQYLTQSNTNMQANFLQILVNLRVISKLLRESFMPATITNQTVLAHGNSTIYDSMLEISQFAITPSDLEKFQLDSLTPELIDPQYVNDTLVLFPSWDLVSLGRIFINVVSNTQPPNGTYLFTDQDRGLLFSLLNATRGLPHNLPAAVHSINEKDFYNNCVARINGNNTSDAAFHEWAVNGTFQYVTDNDLDRFTNQTFRDYVQCAVAPILNATTYMLNQTHTTTSSKYSLTQKMSTLTNSNQPQSSTSTNSHNPSSTSLSSLSPSSIALSNYTSDIVAEFIPYGYWSWAPGQPSTPQNDSTSDTSDEGQLDGGDDLSQESSAPEGNTNIAYQCVALYSDGWRVANCYQNYHFACQNTSNCNDWYVASDLRRTYFEVYKNSCPPGYNFTLPRLAVENLSLKQYMRKANVKYPVWIDLNDITVSGCFVSGGPYAQCPYQRTVTPRTLVKMLAPGSVVALVLLIAIVVEMFAWLHPIETNRKKYWKKKLVEHHKHDYEGVPS